MKLQLRSVVLFSFLAFALLAVATAALGPGLARFYPLLPDAGPAWYYWQLPEPTATSRLLVWGGYAVHQITLWVLLGLGHRQAPERGKIGRYNVLVLGVNLLFVALHLAQTHLSYDGLAQDVPIWSSQGSVIVMLVLMLFMGMPSRGLFLGRSFEPPRRTLAFVRNWHGFYISWALVYTFWFHPMEGNWGLVSGFVYMFLLFIQLSLFNTELHYRKGWVVLLEVFVAVHGTLITVYKENPIWPMFLFGFLAVFVLTQVHVWRRPRWLRWAAMGAYVVAVGLVYGLLRGVGHLYEITFIPVALYGGALALLLVGLVVEKLVPGGEREAGRAG